MNLLPLDDPRWKDLNHRNWSEGHASPWAPDAPFVPEVLSKLVANPKRTELFRDLWPWLCSEGTAWAAAYATVPYAVDFAQRVSPSDRFEYLFFVGFVAVCSCPERGTPFEIMPYLETDYQEAVKLALPLLTETLTLDHNQTDTRYILSTIAALKGHLKLAQVLQDIGCICGECDRCGETVFPPELQQVI